MAFSLRQCLLFCPMSWIYFCFLWACSGLLFLLLTCFQWFNKILGRSFGKQRRNSLTDIRSRDSVDIGEYDVLEHSEITGSDLEETVAFSSSSSSSQAASMCMCTKNKSHPICIPRKTKQKKECYDAFRTSSMCSTLEADDGHHHRTPVELMMSTSEDDASTSTISSTSETSLMFSMSPVK